MLELIILANLMLSSCHGYEIKKVLKGMNVNNNTLYPLLRSLQEKGYVTMELQIQENKPSRKVYTITEEGKNHLFDIINDFDEAKASSNDEFYLRVAFFQFIPTENIEKILDTRENALDNFTNKERIMSFLGKFPDQSLDLLYLHNFVSAQMFSEKQFVESLRQKYGIKKRGKK